MSKSISVFSHNIVAFLLLTAVIYSPFVLYLQSVLWGEFTIAEWTRAYYVFIFGGMLAQLLASAAVMHGTMAHLRAQRATTWESLSIGFRRLLPVLGVGLLVGVLVGVGLLLLVIPGIMLLVKFWVAVPVAVAEKPGVTASLRRSSDLVDGHRWAVFGIAIALVAFNAVLSRIFQQSLDFETMMASDVRSYMLVQAVIAIITTAFAAVVSAVTYHDLRVAKEEISSEDIARAVLVRDAT